MPALSFAICVLLAPKDRCRLPPGRKLVLCQNYLYGKGLREVWFYLKENKKTLFKQQLVSVNKQRSVGTYKSFSKSPKKALGKQQSVSVKQQAALDKKHSVSVSQHICVVLDKSVSVSQHAAHNLQHCVSVRQHPWCFFIFGDPDYMSPDTLSLPLH